MRKLTVFLGVALWAIGSAVSAQEVDSTAPMQKSSWGDASESEIIGYIPDVALDSRFGYGHDFAEGTGRFGGNGLFLDLNGKISPHFSYSMNHRLASFDGGDELGFGNTNWLTLTFETEHFSFTAGKDALFVGSYEYDAYDLDSYWEMNSLFWNNISPWQWGVSAGWYPSEGHSILIQACNSPFSHMDFPNLFAYALAWRAEWDCYEPYWSLNMWQYDAHGYVKALNLGNRFYAGDFTFDLDYSTRCTDLKKAFTSDFTILFSPSYEWEWGRAFLKAGWEKVAEDNFGYEYIGKNFFYGAGAEFFPVKSYKDVRIHAIWASNSHLTTGHYINVGLTWKLNLTGAAKSLLSRAKGK